MCNAFVGSYLEAASRGASVSPRGLSPSSSRPAKEAHEEATPSDPAELHGYDSEETPPGLVSESDSDDEEDYDEDHTFDHIRKYTVDGCVSHGLGENEEDVQNSVHGATSDEGSNMVKAWNIFEGIVLSSVAVLVIYT